MLQCCNYSIKLINGIIPPFGDFDCQSCTVDNHIYIFIEHLYKNKIVNKSVKDFLKSDNTKIRHAAVIYCKKILDDKNILKFMQDDPFYKIRKLCIDTLNGEGLISYFDDVNDEILIKVLEVLYQRYFEYKVYFNDLETKETTKFTENLDLLFVKLTDCMTHTNIQIRILTSKLISILYKLDLKTLKHMLFKNTDNNISGIIVYGLEDECSLVRKNTIISLYIFYKEVILNLQKKGKDYKKIVKILVEYFINTINDEDIQVRNTAIHFFSEMTCISKFKLNNDFIIQISYNLIKTNRLFKEDFDLLKIFRNIRFKSADVFFMVVQKLTYILESKILVQTLYEMFNNNLQFVCKKLRTFTIYAEQEQELFNKDFIVRILTLCVLKQNFSIKRKSNLEKYFLYIDLLCKQPDRLSVMKDNLIHLIRNEKYKDVFKIKNSKDDTINFMILLYKGLQRKNINGLIKLNNKFKNVNLSKSILLDRESLEKWIKNIDLNIIKK